MTSDKAGGSLILYEARHRAITARHPYAGPARQLDHRARQILISPGKVAAMSAVPSAVNPMKSM